MAEIAAASAEQAKGIAQINTAVGQVNQITQQNAANSEQSAAAAEELSAQAGQLADMVGQFKISGADPVPSVPSGRQGWQAAPPKNASSHHKQAPGGGTAVRNGAKVIPLTEEELRDF